MTLVFGLGACTSLDQPGAEDGPDAGFDCDDIATPLSDPPTFYEDNATFDELGDQPEWPADTPESQGLDSTILASAESELAALPFARSLLVLKNDVLVLERYFNGARSTDSNAVHSASKSMLAMLVGIAIDEGILTGVDQRLSTLLPQHFAGASAIKQSITVEHLLTMSAGFEWEEDQTEVELESEPDWINAIVAMPLEATPGQQFNYSTGQSHLLGAALARASGTTLCDFAHARLFAPLGIDVERWGRDPQGFFSGGFNVTMTPRELLRFGQLVNQRGRFDGSQLVPRSWVEAAVSEQSRGDEDYFYGYLFWLWRQGLDTFDIAWGYGGQLVFSIKEHDLVVVITTNTADFEPDYDGVALVKDKIVGALLTQSP